MKLLVALAIFVLLHTFPFTLYPVYADEPAVSSEEQAVYNLNSGLLPDELAKIERPSEPSLIEKLLGVLRSLIAGLFKQGPQKPDKLYSQSETIHQVELPEELKPKSQGDQGPVEKLKRSLGTRTGIYGVELPDFVESLGDRVEPYEEAYEKANFPDEVRPITGQ